MPIANIDQLQERIRILSDNIGSLRGTEERIAAKVTYIDVNKTSSASITLFGQGTNLDRAHFLHLNDVIISQREALQSELEKHEATLNAVNLIVKGANQ